MGGSGFADKLNTVGYTGVVIVGGAVGLSYAGARLAGQKANQAIGRLKLTARRP